jgi:signal peptidase I
VAEVAVLALVIYLFVFQISVVKGQSMFPSFAERDRLIVDKLTYRFSRVARFDVVVFQGSGEEKKDYIKRVVGLPGERVQLRDGTLKIDGVTVRQDFSFCSEPHSRTERVDEVVKAGHYFVMGDNRPQSTDSRYSRIGQVPEGNIRGFVRARIWPPGRVDLF